MQVTPAGCSNLLNFLDLITTGCSDLQELKQDKRSQAVCLCSIGICLLFSSWFCLFLASWCFFGTAWIALEGPYVPYFPMRKLFFLNFWWERSPGRSVVSVFLFSMSQLLDVSKLLSPQNVPLLLEIQQGNQRVIVLESTKCSFPINSSTRPTRIALSIRQEWCI